MTQRDEIKENVRAAIMRVEDIRARVAKAARHIASAPDVHSLERAASECTFTLVNLHIIQTQAEAETFNAPAILPPPSE
jgi:hypothetical protein